MFKRTELKDKSKEILKRNWTYTIPFTMLLILISSILQMEFKIYEISILACILSLVFIGPILVANANYYLKYSNSERPTIKESFSKAFKIIWKSSLALILIQILTTLFTFMLIVPGIIIYLACSQVVYILAENENIKIMEALDLSERMMQGHKWEYFKLQLSYLGWILFVIITLGIGIIWVQPYIETTNALFYKEISKGYK